MNNSVGFTPRPIHMRATSSRLTPPPDSRTFRHALEQGAAQLVGQVANGSGVSPPLMTASVRGAVNPLSTALSGGIHPTMPTTSASPAVLDTRDSGLQYLELQRQMQDENRRYTVLSNVLRARHETARSAINNIR